MFDRSPKRARRPILQWRGALPLSLCAAVLGYVAITDSLAETLRKKVPERAHAVSPGNGRSTAALAKKSIVQSADASRQSRSEQLAKLALRQDPTAIDAVATLGVNARLRGDLTAAKRYFAYSDRLSRRDLATRVWLIEHAAKRNDVDSALQNYDIALRTSRLAPDVLLPVLVRASDEPIVAEGLVRMLAAKPLWTEAFLATAASTGLQPANTARLLTDLHKVGVQPADPSVNATVIARLLAEHNIEAAWAFYRTFRSPVDRRQSRDPHFNLNLVVPSAFDWVPATDNPGITATIQRSDGKGLFDFVAPPSAGGLLLQQMQILPVGEYEIRGRSIGIEQAERARPFWRITCRGGREIGRLVLPNSSQDQGRFRQSLVVPVGCPIQDLQLIARPSTAVNGLSGQITEAHVVPRTN